MILQLPKNVLQRSAGGLYVSRVCGSLVPGLQSAQDPAVVDGLLQVGEGDAGHQVDTLFQGLALVPRLEVLKQKLS